MVPLPLPPPPPEEEKPPVVVKSGECISLTASKTVITPGESVVLTYKTRDVDSVSINHGIGQVTPKEGGTVTVNPIVDTIYVATVTGGSQSENCKVLVSMKSTPTPPPPPPPVTPGSPECIDLSISDTSIRRGQEVTLSWRTRNASSVTIRQILGGGSADVGTFTDANGSVVVRPTSKSVYQASVPGDANDPNCRVSVSIQSSGGGGGGGGGSRSRDRDRDREEPRAFIDSVVRPAEAPLASVYLSEIPYTGLDLGPVGTVFYWLMLMLWSMAAAYLVIFTLVPAVFRKTAAANGAHSSGDLPGWGNNTAHAHGGHDLSVAAPAAPMVHQAAHAASVAHALPARPVAAAPARASVYSPHDGFKSFGENGGLTIDDIVKGLSRETGIDFSYEEKREEAAPAPKAEAREEAPRRAPAAPAPAAHQVEYSDDIVDFIEALLNGNRDHVFGTVRTLNKQGLDTEHFLSQTVCALDDAYRARVEGTEVHGEIERVTRDCHTSFLERLVSSLATAVDSSYSKGVTGSKLALTRALAVVNG